MKPRHVARYLYQGESGYFARMSVPHALRSIIGQKEFWAAIHASSDAVAERKLRAVVVQFQSVIDNARAEAKAGRAKAAPPRRGQSLSPRQLAVAHYSAQMQFDDELRNADHRYAHGFVDDAYVAALRRVISGAADNQGFLETLGGIVHRFQRNGNLSAQFGTPEWRQAVRALAVAELESLARTAERDEDDPTGQPRDPLLTVKPELVVVAKDALAVRILDQDRSTKTLRELLPQLTKESGAETQTNYEREMIARLFEEHLGEAKPIYSITRQDVHGFKRALQELPKHHTIHFPGLSLPEAIKANKARLKPHDCLSTRTINDKHLSKLGAMFNWCVRSDIIPDNPAAGIKIDTVKDKGESRRRPFSPGDLTKIFSPALFDTSKPFDELQWAMLLALFTGARVSELAQIKLDSIQRKLDVLGVAIEEKTKNAKSQRFIPIHSTLIGFGFEKHVGELRASGATHLFPEWYRNGIEGKQRAKIGGKVTLNHHFPRYIARTFNVTIKKKLGIDDKRKVFHSFRHNFTTALDNAGVQDSVQRHLCGRADNSPHAGYIHGQPIEAMKEAIEKLRFDGFALA